MEVIVTQGGLMGISLKEYIHGISTAGHKDARTHAAYAEEWAAFQRLPKSLRADRRPKADGIPDTYVHAIWADVKVILEQNQWTPKTFDRSEYGRFRREMATRRRSTRVMTGARRDSQRQKVYDAETKAFPNDDRGKSLPTVPEMQAYVDSLKSQVWFQRHFRNVTIAVDSGAGCRHALCQKRWPGYILQMPKWARYESVLLHEIAHALHRNCKGSIHQGDKCDTQAPHNWHFAAILVALVQHQMGKAAADRLKVAMRETKARRRPKRTRTMTPEQKAAAAERLAEARAAKRGS